MAQIEQGIEYRGKRAAADLAIEAVAETLEINVGGIHVTEKLLPGRRTDVAGADRHGLDIQLVTGDRHVAGVFKKNDRIIIGKGNACASVTPGGHGQILWGGAVGQGINFPGFTDIPVLTEFATQIASGGPKGEHGASGIKMIQWFFFYGVNAKSTGAPITGEFDLTVQVLSYETYATLTCAQATVARTEIALYPAIVETMPIVSGHCMGCAWMRGV